MKLKTSNSLAERAIFFIVFSGLCLIRILIATSLPLDPEPQIWSYPYALNGHFAEYLINVNLLPPLNYIFDYFPIVLFGPKNSQIYHGPLWQYFIFDILATYFIFKSLQKLKISFILSISIATLFSVAIIPFELWLHGGHYDHYTLLLMSFLVYALVNLSQSKTITIKEILILSVSGNYPLQITSFQFYLLRLFWFNIFFIEYLIKNIFLY